MNSEESQEQAWPGREKRGSSEKGWDKGGSMTVFCYPKDSSESAEPMDLLVAIIAASSTSTGLSDLGTIKGQRASQAHLSSSALHKRRFLFLGLSSSHLTCVWGLKSSGLAGLLHSQRAPVTRKHCPRPRHGGPRHSHTEACQSHVPQGSVPADEELP